MVAFEKMEVQSRYIWAWLPDLVQQPISGDEYAWELGGGLTQQPEFRRALPDEHEVHLANRKASSGRLVAQRIAREQADRCPQLTRQVDDLLVWVHRRSGNRFDDHCRFRCRSNLTHANELSSKRR